jgi:hypothetical protein
MNKPRAACALLAAAALFATPGFAAPDPVPAAGDAGRADPLPSLDDLLSIPQDKRAETPRAGDANKDDLDEQLSQEEAADEFAKVVGLMTRAADRIEASRDVGLSTQRIQEDVLRRLDNLISQAEKNAQKKQQQQQQQQRPKDQQQSQNQQKPQPQKAQQQAQQQGTPDDPQHNPNPPGKDGPLAAPPASASATWGNLPPHIREALMQGKGDKYSALYRPLTEEYYRRLAEEPKK